jgi:hypothetical protein
MSQFQAILESLIILVALCSAAIWMRRQGTIKLEEQRVFGRLVTDFALPAVIFSSLSRVPFSAESLLPALLLMAATLAMLVPAWAIGKVLRLDRPVLGSLLLVASFGGSSTLGISLIRRVFGDKPVVMSDSVLMGEYGVILPVFTLGVAIALYYGRRDDQNGNLWEACKPFFLSPIFLALVFGTIASLIGWPEDQAVIQLIDSLLVVSGRSLIVLVGFSIGLSLKPLAYRELTTLIAIVIVLKLIVEPLVAWLLALSFELPHLQQELLVLQAAMPSGAISAVIAARYGCDGAVASALVIATAILCLVSLPLIVLLGA